MKATGIVRRIDELGRVVVPKEIRRPLRIREGDPLEIFLGRDGEIIFRRYSPLEINGYEARKIAKTAAAQTNTSVYLIDRDSIVYASTERQADVNRGLTKTFLDNIENISIDRNRKNFYAFFGELFHDYISDYYFFPIVVDGEFIGGLIVLTNIPFHSQDVEIMKFSANLIGQVLED